MNALAIIEQCNKVGLRLSLSANGEKLKVNGNMERIDQATPLLRRHKPEIMAHLKQQAANDEQIRFDSPAQESWYYAGYNTPQMRAAFLLKPPRVQDAARRHYQTHVNEIQDHIRTWCSLIRCTQEERQYMLDKASVVDVNKVDGLLWTYKGFIQQFHATPAMVRAAYNRYK